VRRHLSLLKGYGALTGANTLGDEIQQADVVPLLLKECPDLQEAHRLEPLGPVQTQVNGWRIDEENPPALRGNVSKGHRGSSAL
jgi:hypothetical protein